ncbi:MAG: RHS repeat protein [Chloroflexaceae bacterium]|nr:RHS repeat protein [Chloroflexaceae bacterium]
MGRSARWLHRLNLLLIFMLLLSAVPPEPPAPAQAATSSPHITTPDIPATAPQPLTRPEAERTGTTARFNSYLPLIVAAPTPRTATTTITPEQGGTLNVDDITITVPAGAVSASATLTYTGAPLGTDSTLRFRLDATAYTGAALTHFAQPIQISYTPDTDSNLATYTLRHRPDATHTWHTLTASRQLQRVASLVAEVDQPGEFWLADETTPSLVKVAWSTDVSEILEITAVTIGGAAPEVIVREDGIEIERASASNPYDRNVTRLYPFHPHYLYYDTPRTLTIEACSEGNCSDPASFTVISGSSDEIVLDTDIGEGASNPQAFIDAWRAKASGGPAELGKPLAAVEQWNGTETQRYFYQDGVDSIARAVMNPVCGNVYIVRGGIHKVYVENQSVGYPIYHRERANPDQFPDFAGLLNRFTNGIIAQKKDSEEGDYAVYPYPPAVGYIFLEFVPVPNGDEEPTEATLNVTALVLANFGDRQATDPLDAELTLSINGGDSSTVALSSEDGFRYTYTSDERYAIGSEFNISVQVDVTNSTTSLTAKKSVPGTLTIEAGEFQLGEDFPPDPNSSESCTPVDQILLPPDNPPSIRIHKVWNNGEGDVSVQVEATDDIGIAGVVLQSDVGALDSDSMTPRPDVGSNIYEGVIRNIKPSETLAFMATAIDTAGQTASVDQAGRIGYGSLFGDDCEAQCKEGNPVNTALGNDTDTYTDLIVAGRGGTDIIIERTTNSQDVRDGPFGRGSSLYYDMGLEVVNTLLLQGIQIRYGNGRTANFADAGNGRFNPGSLSNFDYITRDGDGYILHQHDRTTFHFDGAGKLREIRTANGVPTTLAYDGAGKLSTITNASGRSVQLVWAGEFISEIRALEGKVLRYAYDGNLLRFFTDARGNTTEYQYDSNGYVTAVITPNGYPHVRQALDERGRVLWQIVGDAERRDFSYDDDTRTTRVTDANGNTTTYVYDENYFIQQVTDARGNSNASEYDARGNLIRYTNRRGFTWTYEYDANGNRIAQSEPVDQFSAVYYTADRSTWLYNEANELLQHTDANGYSTRFTYDANGNLLTVERPDGSVMTMTYNSFGQIETLTDGLGNTSTNTYDATTGDLIAVQDALGNVTRFGYDGLGRQTSVTDPNGNTVTMVYNGNDQVTEIEDARGGKITFVYDANGNLTELYDRLGARTISRYDTADRLIEETDPVGSTTRYTYDAMGYLTSSTSPRGFRREYQYDALYNITGMRDEANNWWYTEYDSENNPIVEIASDGGRTSYTYDAVDRVKFMVNAEGYRYEYCYDAEDQLIRAFDPRRAKTDFVYDPVGRLSRIVNPLGATYDWLYNAVGQVVAETNGEGETNRYVYDAANRLQQAINPLGYTITFERDGVGNITRLLDAMGNPTSYAFDASNNVTSVTNALGDVVRMTYSARDQITSVSEPDGDTSTFSYYPDGTPQFSVRPDGTQLEYRYDENKNPIWIKDTDGQVSTFTYDPRDLLVRENNPNNQTSYYLHDAMLRLVSATDAEGNRSAYAYNRLGWLTSVTDAISSTTSYTHDQVGNTTAITYSNGTTTTFTFNFLNQMVREINGLNHSWIYHYDRAGRLVRQVDGDWQAIRYRHDDAGRMTSAEHVSAGKQVDFTYDRNGNLTAMRDWNGTLRRTYDAINRPLRETDYRGISIGSTWNGDGTRASMQYPDGRTLRYAHDVNNRVQELLLPGGGSAQYAYTPRDQIKQLSLSNGTQSAFQYDAAGRLTDLKTTGVDASVLSWYQFTLDEVGNRTRIVEERQALSPELYAPATRRIQRDFTYDNLYRLREAVVSGDTERTSMWDFDPAGNITRRTVQTPPSSDTGDTGELIETDYQHDALNALVRTGATSFAYNQSGNRIASTTPITQSAYAPLASSFGVSATVVVTQTYDFAQRLEATHTAIRTTLPDGGHAYSPTLHARNVYDGFGRRVEQHATTFITTTTPVSATAPITQAIFYAYNGLDSVVYEEYRSSNLPTFTRSYYHANG